MKRPEKFEKTRRKDQKLKKTRSFKRPEDQRIFEKKKRIFEKKKKRIFEKKKYLKKKKKNI